MGKWPTALSALFLIVVVAACAAAPLISQHDPTMQQLRLRFAPPVWVESGTRAYPMGADQLGRDVLTRVLHGGRVSLAIGLTASTVSALLGVSLGLISGYYRGLLDSAIMRLVDIQLAFPFLVLAIAVTGVLGSSLNVLVVVLGLSGWATFARVVRAEVLVHREKEYVLAAESAGASRIRIMWKHLLPNVFAPVIVLWTFAIAQMITLEGALSYLGMGVKPPNPSWGGMMSDGRQVIDVAWWITTMPGLALMATVMAINTLGDALRDVLDPKMQL